MEPRRHDRRSVEPYLSGLDGDATQSVTVMEWARYLAATFGTEGAVAALRFYEDVGWIAPSVRRTMVDYVRGLSLDELAGDDDPEVELPDGVERLADTPFAEHAKSIEYIATISGDSLERALVPLRLPEDQTPPTATPPSAGAGDSEDS